MLFFRHGRLSFDLNRCCQCGTCLAACPHDALYPVLREDGLYEIARREEECRNHGECVAVCPAHHLTRLRISEDDWEQTQGVFFGYSRDPDLRRKATSGGLGRTLLATALSSSTCDEAYCVAKSNAYPWGEGRFFRGSVDLERIANSMYIPILVNQNLTPRKKETRLLVIGTHCQLLGMQRYFRKSKVHLTKIALVCKQQKTYEFTKFIARRLGQDLNRAGAPRYRGEGWPGRMRVGHRALTVEDAVGLPMARQLWVVPGCRFCAHPLGSNADITLGDPWAIDRENRYGRSLTIVRTSLGTALLDICSDHILLEPGDVERAKKSVGWKAIQRKLRLIPFHLGGKLPPARHKVAAMGQFQRRAYETLLQRLTLPRTALRIMDRLPFVEDWV